jgi:hypothetical protein
MGGTPHWRGGHLAWLQAVARTSAAERERCADTESSHRKSDTYSHLSVSLIVHNYETSALPKSRIADNLPPNTLPDFWSSGRHAVRRCQRGSIRNPRLLLPWNETSHFAREPELH